MGLKLTVNGVAREIDGAWGGESLLYALRERLGLPGSKNACEQGECGSCSVYLDGTLVCACLVLAAQAAGREVVTVEGLAPVGRAARDPAGLRRRGRRPVRLLHAGADRREPRPAPAHARPGRRRDPRGARRQPLPLHGLREDHRRRAARGGADGGGRGMSAPAVQPAGSREESGPARSGSTGSPRSCGEFAYASDLHVEGMLWGATLRSPHPRARIRALDTSAAAAVPGVHAVLTHADVPGRRTYGLEHADQPVLAWDDVRFQGEPIAIVAADHPETARHAADAIRVEYEVLDPLCDAEAAMAPGAPPLHEGGNVLRRVAILHGDPEATAPVVVTGDYEVGMQDQAFLGPESGLAVPDGAGGVELHIATQWLHVDRDQVAVSLGLRARARAAGARRRGRRLRRARGPVDADPRVHARAPHGPPGEDGLHARGVVLRPRPPPPVHAALRARGRRRRPARLRPRADRARRRRLRVELDRGVLERRLLRGRPVRRAERTARGARRLHEQPALRGHARLRGGPGGLRARGADGQARGGARHGPGRRAAAQRDRPRRPAADGAGPARAGARGRAARARARDAAAARAGRPARPARAAGRGGQHDPRRGRAARRRLRGGDQEHRLLGGLRRLLDRARARRRRRRRPVRRGPHRGGGGRPGPDHRAGADRPHGARARARRRAARRHRGGLGRLDLGLAPDLRDRRRRQGGVRRRAQGAGRAARRPRRARRGGRGAAGRGDGRVAPPPDVPARRARPGRRAPAVRLLRAPRGGRRRRRARPRARRRAGHGPGGRPRDEPAVARGPDRGRLGAGAGTRADGGDRRARRRGAQRLVHGLPDPDDARHAAGARSRCSSTPTPRRPTASRASASRRTSRRRRRSSPPCARRPAARSPASPCAPSTSCSAAAPGCQPAPCARS